METNFKGSRIVGGNSEYGRVACDYYPTPPEATQALINFLMIPKDMVIWEPACGEGNMADTFIDNGYNVIASDLNDFGYGHTGVDFTKTEIVECDWIITNPPFNLAEEFIKTCMRFQKPFALLLKSQYWHSKKRLPLFNKTNPVYILPLTWRPDFLAKSRGGGSPLMDVMWTVWNPIEVSKTQYVPLGKPSQNIA